MKYREIRKKRMGYLVLALLLFLAASQALQVTYGQNSTQNNPWALSFQILKNGQNAVNSSFAPFDQIQLFAKVTYENASVPNILVTFKAQSLSNSANVTRIISTNATGEAEFSFRLPIESQNNASIVGAWQATAAIKTTDGVLRQNLSFSTQWNMEITSIVLQNSQGQNQTTFQSGKTLTIKLSINNKAQPKAANITLSIKDSLGKLINQTQIYNKQIDTSSSLQANLQIPSTATAGQAAITAVVYSGNYRGTAIPASENKTAPFTITATSTSTPKPQPFENTISLFSWLLIATGLFTFTSLTLYLRRKPYPPNTQTLEDQSTPASSSAVLIDSSQLGIPSNSDIEAIVQQAGLQPLANQLNTMSSTAQRIDALLTALKMERAQLAKEIVDLNRTVEEQEKAVKKYFDAIRQQAEKYGASINDQGYGKPESNENQTNKSKDES